MLTLDPTEELAVDVSVVLSVILGEDDALTLGVVVAEFD